MDALTDAQQHLRVVEAEWCDMQAHLQVLRRAVLTTKAERVAELGVRRGASTTALLAGLEVTGGRLWSCDLVQHQLAELRGHPLWSFHEGDSTSADTFARCHRPLDVLFIDSSHQHEQTTRELATYGGLVRPGGLVILHDADVDGVALPALRWALGHEYRATVHPRDHGLIVIEVDG